MVDVKLIAYTQLAPNLKLEKRGDLSDPEFICAVAARNTISHDRPEELLSMHPEVAKRSLNAVINYGHWSVLEHASFTFLVWNFSRIISQQLTRHRIASFSQRGQRYVKWKNAKYIIPPTIKRKSDARKVFEKTVKQIEDAYAELLKLGIPAEDARFILPNAVETYIVFTMNARELLHFFKLRLCSRAQWEIRELAFKMLDAVLQVAPQLFQKAGPMCISEGRCLEKNKDEKECMLQIQRVNRLKKWHLH